MIWEFRASPLKIIDGDTIDVYVDQGFRTYRKEGKAKHLGYYDSEEEAHKSYLEWKASIYKAHELLV